MAEVDTSFYKDATAENPLDMAGKVVDFRNKLLTNTQQQQQVQSNNIKLATERFGMINNAASGLLSDPELGVKDVTKKLWDTLGRLTKGDAMSAAHAVQFMQQFPQDPRQQAQAIKDVHSQTMGAWEKGRAYLGEVQGIGTGGGTKFVQQPAFGGGAPQDKGFLPNTLQPGTTKTNPDLSQSYVGDAGNPAIQPPVTSPPPRPGAPRAASGPATMPAVNGAPERAAVPSSKRVVGDAEAVSSGLYDAPGGTKPIVASPSPGEAEALKGSAVAYNDAMLAGAKYAQRVNPLRQAIPLIEKMKETDIGPSSERWNDIKSTALTLGAGKLAGIDPEKIKDYNELKKYFSQYTSQAAATLGPKTNDGLATAVTSNPNVHMDKLSATDLSKMALGAERMQQAGAHEFDEQVRAGKAKPGDFNRFMLKWGTEQDPRAFVYDILDKKAQEAVRKLPPAERAKVAKGMQIAEKWKLLGDVHRE
jgi:hypothetical protein